jgi:hypothetical protein
MMRQKSVWFAWPPPLFDCADLLRHCVQVADEFLDRFFFQVRFARDCFVHISHVSRVVLAVMNFHRLRVDKRFQRILWIR